MRKILFVCHGNICRSPMAELILKDLVAKAGRSDAFQIDSAAVSREEEGNPVYPPARRELERHGVACMPRRARVITLQDCRWYDEIYYMDRGNLRNLRRMFPGENGFRPLLPRDVADPYYSGDFSRTWADIREGCEKIMEELE